MALIGFILLLIGGGLLLFSGTSLALDPATALLIANFLNTILGPPTGDTLVSILIFLTSIGGILILIGAIIWYATGSGFFAIIGKILVSIGSFTAFYYVVNQLIIAWGSGIFSQPIEVILSYFLGLGLGFAAVVMIVIGSFIGAGRRKTKVEYVPADTGGA
ncbi:MAG: hypothetical protein ACFFD8_05735 [Candidatus Thorarchaeota archaeon]